MLDVDEGHRIVPFEFNAGIPAKQRISPAAGFPCALCGYARPSVSMSASERMFMMSDVEVCHVMKVLTQLELWFGCMSEIQRAEKSC